MKRKLFSVSIHDCRVDTFCSGGKGGQHQNATKSGVRVVHEPSGAAGECREERHQLVNKQRAFRSMAESRRFQWWARQKAAELQSGKTVDQLVEDELKPQNLLLEARDEDGNWVTLPVSELPKESA